MRLKDYMEYPHHIENIETIKNNPDYFDLELTFKEKLKSLFRLHNSYKFKCWVKDKSGKRWKCFINYERTQEHPYGYVKFLGKVR